ncbi:hypothetical protein I3500192B8_14910 [Acidaminococcus intestini]|uniref:hypothetical protein n=1 Tax=Acidaminococcus intestini TaxID=187327 RepID=UPI0036F229A8
MKSTQLKQEKPQSKFSGLERGDLNVLLQYLEGSPEAKIIGIIAAIIYNNKSDQCVSLLRKIAKGSDFASYGGVVAEYAIAALDILGIEKYHGSNKRILGMIQYRFKDLENIFR